ncbi:MAG: 4Fe-4S binding protein [Desulfuromonadaceae bacterium]|nr:4Fe-4S binding protein [Desulfuromonadaceae bacterium]MDD2847367.1 4Fe-4S binding protein [Desulfuromonadaceae bacterium]MDD4131520.1 4Fe-4S binding protein [Desulfuromonadaceae bacterium]
MTISRKNFFKQGFFSLGETLLKAGRNVLEEQDSPSIQGAVLNQTKEPVPDENLLATADNQHCLAKNCGCFSCVDRCESGAIMLIPGTGIRIDEKLCSGCGICHYICPVTPKAVRLQARATQPPSASQAELPAPKGESPC